MRASGVGTPAAKAANSATTDPIRMKRFRKGCPPFSWRWGAMDADGTGRRPGRRLGSSEIRHDRGVVAGAHVRPHRAGGRSPRERGARQDVVDPPADVALAEVAPRRPPREEALVVGIEGPADVDHPLRENRLEERALVLALADDAGLALLGVDIPVGQRDVDVAAEEELPAGLAALARVADER